MLLVGGSSIHHIMHCVLFRLKGKITISSLISMLIVFYDHEEVLKYFLIHFFGVELTVNSITWHE